jgi:hypothetical protein
MAAMSKIHALLRGFLFLSINTQEMIGTVSGLSDDDRDARVISYLYKHPEVDRGRVGVLYNVFRHNVLIFQN